MYTYTCLKCTVKYNFMYIIYCYYILLLIVLISILYYIQMSIINVSRPHGGVGLRVRFRDGRLHRRPRRELGLFETH